MQRIKCNLCGKDDYVVLYEKGRFNMPVRNVICRNCGLVYINPRMSEEDYKKFYSSNEYRELYDGKGETVLAYEKKSREATEKTFNYLGRKLAETGIKKGKVLDIGCGTGYLLSLFKKKGWKCLGIEPSEKFSSYGRKKYRIAIKTGLFGKVKIREKFGLIILLQALEHFLDVNNALQALRRYLKPSGLLYIELPNIRKPYSNLSFFFQNAHPFTFSPNTLKAMLAKNGFHVVSSDDSGVFLKVIARESKIQEGEKFCGDDYKEIMGILGRYRIKRAFIAAYDRSLRSFFNIMSALFGKKVSKKLFDGLKRIKIRFFQKQSCD